MKNREPPEDRLGVNITTAMTASWERRALGHTRRGVRARSRIPLRTETAMVFVTADVSPGGVSIAPKVLTAFAPPAVAVPRLADERIC